MPYTALKTVLDKAFNQASQGKGKERHANNKPFTEQPICEIGRMVGLGYPLGQAMKKCQESLRLVNLKGVDSAKAELYGAINYIASAIIILNEHKLKEKIETSIQEHKTKQDISCAKKEHCSCGGKIILYDFDGTMVCEKCGMRF